MQTMTYKAFIIENIIEYKRPFNVEGQTMTCKIIIIEDTSPFNVEGIINFINGL